MASGAGREERHDGGSRGGPAEAADGEAAEIREEREAGRGGPEPDVEDNSEVEGFCTHTRLRGEDAAGEAAASRRVFSPWMFSPCWPLTSRK